MIPKGPRNDIRAHVAESLRREIERVERIGAATDKLRARLEAVESGEAEILAEGHALGRVADYRTYRVEDDGNLTPMTAMVWRPEGRASHVLAYEPGDKDRIELSEQEARERYPEKVAEIIDWLDLYRRAKEASPDGIVRVGDMEKIRNK